MPSIRILSDQVVNQIAAGEVIERPVAVVKELLENSLDAGASRIEIEFRHGGKSYIRVEDDGCGMALEDVKLCLQRHATSKLQQAKDLAKIRSFGFRGEALPSIASVSRFTLRSRLAGSDAGSEIFIDAGKVKYQRACGMPLGTLVEVSQLFNSVPARRAFLKTDATEAAHIVQLARLYAVAHPQVSFVLIDNGRRLFASPACEKLYDRVAAVWGRNLAKDLFGLSTFGNDRLQCSGLLAKPGASRATRQELITFVNGRPVDSRMLSYTLTESYHTYIPKGRFPMAFIFMDINPEDIDINVHPAKREIRFRREGEVRQVIIQGVSAALQAYQSESMVASLPTAAVTMEVSGDSLGEKSTATPTACPAVAKPIVRAKTAAAERTKDEMTDSLSETAINNDDLSPTTERMPESTPATLPTAFSCDWQYIGTWGERCLLYESQAGLIILHALHAQQRITFERMLAACSYGATAQQLLIPIALELAPLEAAVIVDCQALLEGYGFALEPFGRNFFRVTAVPVWLESEDIEAYLRDLTAQIRNDKRLLSPDSSLQELLARLAVQQASSPVRPASEAQALALVDGLLQCTNPHTCPYGRPTFFELSRGDIHRRLGR